MKEFHGRASTNVDAEPRRILELITDVDRLPEWNAAIEAVVKKPTVLHPGEEWMVKMHPPHVPSWKSVSRVDELDLDTNHFAYETRNADGNPSYTKWAWDISSAGEGAQVTVTWDCYLKTLDRRILAGPLRKRQLAREVENSLGAIAAAINASESP